MNRSIASSPALPADETTARSTRREFLVGATAAASGLALVAMPAGAGQEGHAGGPPPPASPRRRRTRGPCT